MPYEASNTGSFYNLMTSMSRRESRSASRRESGSTRLEAYHVKSRRDCGYQLATLDVDQLISTDQVLDRYDRAKAAMGRSAGPDGLRLELLHRRDVAKNVKVIVRELKAGTFTTTEPRLAQHPKPSGKGTRDLRIFNVCERLVASSANEILTQLICPRIHRMFHGYLTDLGTSTFYSDIFDYLTRNEASENIYCTELDIRKAFDEIQVAVVRKALLAQGIPPITVDTILTLSGAERNTVGLPQGNALCPILFTTTVCHGLVGLGTRKHIKANPMPAIYADNFCYLSKSESEMRKLIDGHTDKLKTIGLEWGPREQPKNLRKEETASVMGTLISIEGSKIRFRMSSKTVNKARDTYKASIAEADPAKAARERLISIVTQWGHIAATTEDNELRSTLDSITQVKGIEQPDLQVIVRAWRTAGNNWLQKHSTRHAAPNNSPGKTRNLTRTVPGRLS